MRRGSLGRGGSGSQTRRKARAARPLLTGVSPGRVTPAWVAPARRSVSPSPGPSPSPPASPLGLLLHFPPQQPPPCKRPRLPGACAPLPPMCPRAPAQFRGPASWPASGRGWLGQGYLSRMLSLLRDAGSAQPRWAQPCEDCAPLPTKNGVEAAIAYRVECAHPPIVAPLVPGSEL